MLFSDRKRVVIEVDGKQHYAVGDTATPPALLRDGR
jgi:very-short-patch-repair endonuclease